MGVYSVWVQPVDDYTTPENLDKYGTVHDVFAEYENDDGGTPNKQFCDGQTSKTPPRYAQDRMIGIYTRTDEAAQIISESLRDDVAQRVMSGQLALTHHPQWLVSITGVDPLAVVAEFVPAKTIEEATERLRVLGGEGFTFVNFDDLDIDKMNEILRATEITVGRYPVDVNYFGYALRRAGWNGSYSYNSTIKSGSVQMRKEYLSDPRAVSNKTASLFMSRSNGSYPRWSVSSVSDSPIFSTQVHECHHAIYQQRNLAGPWRRATKSLTDAARATVGEYSAIDPSEFFAEVGSAIASGVPIDPTVVEAYEIVMKGII